MKRRLFTILSALSLLLCVASIVMWLRSYWASDELFWVTVQINPRNNQIWSEVEWRWASSEGWWCISDFRHEGAVTTLTRSDAQRPATLVEQSYFQRHSGADSIPMQFSASRHGGETPVPYWLTVLGFAIVPAAWTLRRARQLMRAAGTQDGETHPCPSCGYDLRATPERCPECGAKNESVQAPL